MVEQYKKTSAERDMPLIHQHMMHTFPLQREEMITTSSPVSELKDRWPALFYETQDKHNIHATRTAALAGLPIYRKKDSSDMSKTCMTFQDEMEF
ncbi:hypothetical protein ATANTOWER_012097 [Ataeniobius toweri]|uniref:Uncharacterized protein n=1 Tax=Ataeniobius toweri TaxID=208326 RepID=A0ABU7BS66_9TELE|nr:hypothetical protein [Ataeniobius toweri]